MLISIMLHVLLGDKFSVPTLEATVTQGVGVCQWSCPGKELSPNWQETEVPRAPIQVSFIVCS